MTIAEVSKKYNISQDTLRYYERIGIIPHVERNSSGIRNYTEESCGWIELAICMRSAGVQIEPLIEYCELVGQGESTISARKSILEEERTKLQKKIEDMERALERLNYKIGKYEEAEKTGTLKWD
ncbi:MAG TPA: MerR family transcriptional regulator [Lachnospiraceae bacterium]|nr:MerR family transcriptional regulator [uncultured Lachnoclostridium sp.]HAU85418.1 MerR family transcriptional regulator [Lachnospiraceae bacterium]